MATVAQADSKGMYSWWWNSHISPKNSKWLQENLTDMDSKVKQMIKLIEEDADSFARRAEMYYKKRPELMKLVEEFYRAYRALAERYDHATVVLCQAHRTMAEAFPNQVPMLLGDDLPAASATEADPRTPDMPAPMRVLLEPDQLQKDALGLSSYSVKRNGAFTEEPDSVTSRKGLKQLHDLFGSGDPVTHSKFAEGRARKGLNFHDLEDRERDLQNNGSSDVKVRVPSESERVGKAEMEILTLKNALAKIEAEKEAGLLQYQQSLERLSNLEVEVSRAQQDSRGLDERASKAEAEVQTLKDSLSRLEAERVAGLAQYQQCLEKISNLENKISHFQKDAGELNERASIAEMESQALKQDLARVEAEKEAALAQYKQCLETIANLEEKLLHAEENARKLNEQLEKAESEVETLKQAIIKLTEEKETAAFQYQQCLETIANLEQKIACAQEEAQRLNNEIDDGVEKLKGAEERCLLLERSNQSLHTEMESLVLKVGAQNEELTEKQRELGRLWASIQEERLRFMEAETAFQTLQHLHSQSQDELRSLAMELQNRAQLVKDIEALNQGLEDEVHKVREENKSLTELNLSSAVSIKSLQDEILSLRETIQKLEAEVGLRVDERNALQQEIYCLKEELNDLTKRHQAIMGQMESVGLNPECFGSSVKELQDENMMLKEVCEKGRDEKLSLLEKLEVMEKLIEKNAALENSISDLNVELGGVRGKVRALEESCHTLFGDKSTLAAEKEALISQLQIATEKLEKFSEKKNFLENSLYDANVELEGLRVKSKSLEDSCLLLGDEKSGLISERESLTSQLNVSQKRLNDLEKIYMELEEKFVGLEKERESTLREVEQLQNSLYAEKQEHTSFAQLSEAQRTAMESQIHFVKEESQCRKKEYEEELEKVVMAQMEIFILQKCIKDLEEKNSSLFIDFLELLDASKLSEKRVSELEHKNCENQLETKSLLDQINVLRVGLLQLLKILETDAFCSCENKIEQDQFLPKRILARLQEMQNSLSKALEENQQSAIEKSVLIALLEQLKLDLDNLAAEKNVLHQELVTRSEEFSVLHNEAQNLTVLNEELRSKLVEGGCREEVLGTEMENVHRQLSDLQMAYQNILEENSNVLDEKTYLMKEVSDLCEEKCNLEEETCVVFAETVTQSNMSLILTDIVTEKLEEINLLRDNLDRLNCVNNVLEQKVRIMERKLEEMQMENSHLKESLENLANELISVRSVSDQLSCEVATGKELLCQKENALLEAEQVIIAAQNESSELHEVLNNLKGKYEEVNQIREDQENQILKISSDYDHQSKETECLRQANQKFEAKLCTLREELEESKDREENLSCEVQRERKEVELWEIQAVALFDELNISAVRESLLEEKTHDLAKACGDLESRSTSKAMEAGELKERISILEGENGGLKAQLASYAPVVSSLKDTVIALESHTLLHNKFSAAESNEVKDTMVSELQAESSRQTVSVPDGISELEDMQMRIKAIEKAVVEMERLAMLENLNANSKLEAAVRQIKELKSGSSSEENVGANKHNTNGDVKMQKQTPETAEGNEVMTKDIMLDQISECSSYGISRRGTVEVDDQMLELWETADHDGSIDLKVGKTQNELPAPTDSHQMEAVKQNKGKKPSAEFMVKELGVDKLEISNRFGEPQQDGGKRKILERLDSDVQKLTNLQITVQDLKRKVEITEKDKKGKGADYDTVKEQLEEAAEAIVALFDVNRKLVSHVEGVSFGSSSFDWRNAMDPQESGSVRRRRIADQARKVSEKIGRLQLEVQKLQFLLLKLEDEKGSRGRPRVTDGTSRVLLRDYLYGRGRTTSQKRKKAPFCACVQPPTKGD